MVNQAEIHKMVHSEHAYVRRNAARILGSAFPQFPDKTQAWEDLHRLTQDTERYRDYYDEQYEEDRYFNYVRQDAAEALGSAFPHIPDKKLTCEILYGLTHDKNSGVRAYANHSLGRISIFNATEARSEEEFKQELEKALDFFEESSKERCRFNPAKFCLPFYRSFYDITFKKEEIEAEVQKYFAEAKSVLEGSESYYWSVAKGKLLEAVENLADALKEVHKTRDMGVSTQSDLDAYRRYLRLATILLDTTEEKAPIPTKLIKKGLPIIDEKINRIIAEIKEKAEEAYQESRGTPTEEIASAVKQEVKKWEISDQEQMTRNVEDLTFILKSMIPFNPKNEHIHAKIEEIRKAKDVTKQYAIIKTLIALIPIVSFEEIHKKLDRIDVKTDKIIEYVQKIEISCNQIIYNLEKSGVKLKDEEKEELKNLVDDLKRANKEQLNNLRNELIKWLEDSKCQEEIEKTSEEHRPKIKKIFSKIKEITGELGIALSAALTAEGLLPYIEQIMHQIIILSEINPALASTFILIPLITFKRTLK